MALAVASTSNLTAYGTTAVITKPTGLAVGDLMVAIIASNSTTSTTINTASGWTSVGQSSTAVGSVSIQIKIAEAADVSASTFTFTDDDAIRVTGGILRVTGAPTLIGSVVADSETDSYNSTQTPTISFTTSLTPIVANSLVVIGLQAEQGPVSGAGSIGSYVSTPSITFTELFDVAVDLGNNIDPVCSGAYGIHTTTSEITAYGATINDAGRTRHSGVIAVISPKVDATGTNATFEISPVLFTQAGSAGTTGTNAFHEASPTFFEQNGKGTSPTQWTNEDKPSTTWTNESL